MITMENLIYVDVLCHTYDILHCYSRMITIQNLMCACIVGKHMRGFAL